MLIDVQALLSDNQAVTVTAFSANQYDQGATAPRRNLGRKELRLTVECLETVTAAGAATVTFELGEADDAAGTNFTAFYTTPAIPKATLVAGYNPLDMPLPDTGARRMLMLRYTVGTGPLTAGKFTAALVLSTDHQRIYNDGYAQGA